MFTVLCIVACARLTLVSLSLCSLVYCTTALVGAAQRTWRNDISFPTYTSNREEGQQKPIRDLILLFLLSENYSSFFKPQCGVASLSSMSGTWCDWDRDRWLNAELTVQNNVYFCWVRETKHTADTQALTAPSFPPDLSAHQLSLPQSGLCGAHQNY